MVAVAPLACDNFRPRNKLTVTTFPDMKIPMIGRTIAVFAVLTCGALMPATTRAQDVPGIEICTAEKTMERRTSCLQSNVDFLQKTIAKLAADHQQKLDAANRQIEALKVSLAGLQKIVSDLQAAEKATEDAKKKAAPAAAKDAPAAKDSPAAK
jgi:septal ring factor EnvC (AmiA/AmiB activator)